MPPLIFVLIQSIATHAAFSKNNKYDQLLHITVQQVVVTSSLLGIGYFRSEISFGAQICYVFRYNIPYKYGFLSRSFCIRACV